MVQTSLIGSFVGIPEEKRGIWESHLEQDDAGRVTLFAARSKYGTLRFGLDRDGHVGWRFEHVGGAILLPYFVSEEHGLMVGLLIEQRLNLPMKDPSEPYLHLCAIGGFRHPQEPHFQCVLREAGGEISVQLPEKDVQLLGPPVWFDRNFGTHPTSQNGVLAYGYALPDHLVSTLRSLHVARPEMLTMLAWHSPKQRAHCVVFLPWRRAVHETQDVLARAGIAALLTHAID
jgi:hypothetical protein